MEGGGDELAGRRVLLDLGEERIIEEHIVPALSPPQPGELLGPGEDARDILPRGPRMLIAHDGYSVKTLRLPWRTMVDIGYAAVMGAASDLVAKGAAPHAVTVALGLENNTRIMDLDNLIQGIVGACHELGARYMGGDTNISADPWISVSAIGFTVARPPGRGGARPGDIIVATGVYGAMGAVALDHRVAERYGWVREATRRPRVRVELAYIVARHHSYITSSMDVSDGLSYTLYTMSRLSGHAFLVTEPPLYHPELPEYCAREIIHVDRHECIWDRVMHGGEEYGAVLTIRPEGVIYVLDEMKKLEIPHKVIGRVVDEPPGLYREEKGRRIPVPVSRWDQFRGWTTITV